MNKLHLYGPEDRDVIQNDPGDFFREKTGYILRLTGPGVRLRVRNRSEQKALVEEHVSHGLGSVNELKCLKFGSSGGLPRCAMDQEHNVS